MNLKIGLDCDGVICDFYNPYLQKFGEPKGDFEISRNVSRKLLHDKDFWMNLPLINKPNFEVTLFCTKRKHNKEWTRKYLLNHQINKAPIYQIYCQSSPKSKVVRNKVDVFIDDSISNFIEMNLNGVPCLLMDNETNKSWGPIGRIYSLDYSEIESAYFLFINDIFDNFKNLL